MLQLIPQAPQFVLSLSRLHTPLQFVSVVPQHAAGVPDLHVSPIVVSHIAPHVPQLLLSVCVFLHMLEQHVSLPPHAIVHEPQCASSFVISTHVPLQFVRPVAQQVVMPLFVWQVPAPQLLLHAPQFVLLVVRSTQVPPQFV